MFGFRGKKKSPREEEFTLNTSLATLQTLLGRTGHGPTKPPSSSVVAVFSDPPSAGSSKTSRKKGLRRAPLRDANARLGANRPGQARKCVRTAVFCAKMPTVLFAPPPIVQDPVLSLPDTVLAMMYAAQEHAY